MDKTANQPKYPVQTLEKALEIIELLSKAASNSGLGISELSRDLDIGKSTVHRILTTMMAYGYVDKVPNKTNYRLGWKLYEIGSIVPYQRDLGSFDIEILQSLCNQCKETVNLGVLVNNYVVIISKVESVTTLRANFQIGAHEPVYATALGKVLTSELEEDKLKQIFIDETIFEKNTANTITSYQDFLPELKKVRQQGYAIDDQEYCLGISCIAMPVRNFNNEIVAAISVTGPSIRLNFSKILEIKEALAKASLKLSEYLGYKPGEEE